MQLTNLAVVLVLFTVRACRANIVLPRSRRDASMAKLVEDLINIQTSCYGDQIDGITLAGNLPVTLISTLSARHLIPVALIGNTYKFGDQREKMPVQHRHKLHFFIVEGTSFKQLDRLIEMNIKYSMWWNHMASFFIIDMSLGCVNVNNYLFLAWYRNILNAKVICYPNESGTIMFNYNPFTSQAPSSWQQFSVFPLANEHLFTVFSRQYRGNSAMCVDLDFKKTNDLGGYPIVVKGERRVVIRTQSNRGYYQFRSRLNRIFDTFQVRVNATLMYFDGTKKYPSPMDIGNLPYSMVYTWNVYSLSAYPHEYTGYVLVSRFRGHKSQLDKILSVIDGSSRIGMWIVYLITFMFFKFFVRQPLVTTFLNLIRITCNTGFTNLPGNTASRIYLGCLLFFAVTMQGIYQGKLASLLTTEIPLPNVNTFQDLLDFDYKICGRGEDVTMVDHPVVKERYMPTGLDDCITKVKHDPLTALWAYGQGDTLDIAQQFNLHISKEILSSTYVGFYIRWDWPLDERFNIILQRLVEADAINPWDVHCNELKFTEFEFDEAVKNNKDFRNIKLDDLTFAFVILGIGLACATITFIIELAVKYKCVWRVSFVRR